MFDPVTVPIVLAFDNNYVPVSAVFIRSLVASKNARSIYKIYIIADRIHPVERIRLENIVSSFDSVSLYFLDAHSESFSAGINPDRHSTASTFFRLKLPSLFPHLDRVIYLDTDMICNVDLAELMSMDVSNYFYAAALDINHIRGLWEGHWQRDYYTSQLQWPEAHVTRYKQAGVILFNLEKMRIEGIEDLLLSLIDRNFRLMDQDILNIAVPVDEVLQLDFKWNLLTSYRTIKSSRDRLPSELYEAYMSAYEDPAIVHFGGTKKPWNSSGDGTSLHQLFWRHAKETDFYTQLLLTTVQNLTVRQQGS